MKSKWLLLIVASMLAFTGSCAGSRQAEPISETRLLLDTYCTVSIHEPQDREILSKALDLCAEYEKLLSISVEGSDVWRINHGWGEPVTVAPQTAEIIRAGLEYGELSGGMFDITIGRLTTLWDFTGKSGVPAEPDIISARDTVDYRQVIIDGDMVQLTNPEAWIDLGGIAKGYIADKVAEFLREKGVRAAVVDLGGNIVVVGQKADGSRWNVGITKPFSERNDLIGIVETSEASVVSSGVYERRFEQDGIIYHHILDPNTGKPVDSGVTGVTVVSDSSMAGDALSTMILLLGRDRAGAVIDEVPGIAGAVLVLEGGEVSVYGDVDFHAAE